MQKVQCVIIGVSGHEIHPDDSFTQVAFNMYPSGVERATKIAAELQEHLSEKILQEANR